MKLHGKFKLNRDVTPEECNWLDRTFKKGEVVFESYAATYGCISNDGEACCLTTDKYEPFFELPYEALDRIDVKAEAEKQRKKTLDSRKKALAFVNNLPTYQKRSVRAYIKRLEEIAKDDLKLTPSEAL